MTPEEEARVAALEEQVEDQAREITTWRQRGLGQLRFKDTNALFASQDTGKPVTSARAVDPADTVLLCDCSAGNVTLTLPPAANARGAYRIKKTDASLNIVTIASAGSETIDDSPTQTINDQYDSLDIVSDRANWYIV